MKILKKDSDYVLDESMDCWPEIVDDPSDVDKLAATVVVIEEDDEFIESDETRLSLSDNNDWNVFIVDVSTFVTCESLV